MPNQPPRPRKNEIESTCPKNCTAYGLSDVEGEALRENEFIIDSDGQMCINKTGECKTVRNT